MAVIIKQATRGNKAAVKMLQFYLNEASRMNAAIEVYSDNRGQTRRTSWLAFFERHP
jgi:hypothetical protein